MLNKNNKLYPNNKKMSGSIPNNGIQNHKYIMETDRLQTFTLWTKTEINTHELAKYGFYFTGVQDCVKCAFCGVELRNWIIGDHPLNKHAEFAPRCPLLLRKSQNIPIHSNFNDQLPAISSIVKTMSGEDIIKLTGNDAVLHPGFRTYISRLQSFKDWPKSLRPTPHELSDAGFFYLEKSDQTKCFCCGGIIENWDTGWNAWEQHIHRFEECHYVQLCTTPEIIENIRAKFSGKPYRSIDYINNRNNDERVSRRQEEMEHDQQNITKTCNICFNEELNAIFLPCMHVYTCTKCGFSITHCPVCRQKITEVKKCFII